VAKNTKKPLKVNVRNATLNYLESTGIKTLYMGNKNGYPPHGTVPDADMFG
jgi:hypothetical protein